MPRPPSSCPPSARPSASSSAAWPRSRPRSSARIAIREAVRRAAVDPGSVDEVIMGHVVQGGAGQAPARQAQIKAGIPAAVGALTINKVCGSGLKAVMLAAQAIRAGRRRDHRRRRHGVDVERAALPVRHAHRRQARRHDAGRRRDPGRPVVLVQRLPHGRARRVHGREGRRVAASTRTQFSVESHAKALGGDGGRQVQEGDRCRAHPAAQGRPDLRRRRRVRPPRTRRRRRWRGSSPRSRRTAARSRPATRPA